MLTKEKHIKTGYSLDARGLQKSERRTEIKVEA